MVPTAVRDRYLNDAVATVTPQRLVTMLYDGLLSDLNRAEPALAIGDIETAHRRLVRAQDILHELLASLDPTKWDGGTQLQAVYAFLIGELVAANVAKDGSKVAACRRIVEPLRDAWHLAAAIEVL